MEKAALAPRPYDNYVIMIAKSVYNEINNGIARFSCNLNVGGLQTCVKNRSSM